MSFMSVGSLEPDRGQLRARELSLGSANAGDGDDLWVLGVIGELKQLVALLDFLGGDLDGFHGINGLGMIERMMSQAAAAAAASRAA